MRVVIQLVDEASLSIQGHKHASITQGMVCFVGFTHLDNQVVINTMIERVLKLRVFPDRDGKSNLSLSDINGQLLVVPNFTLYADTMGSRRPSFSHAAKSEVAAELFTYLQTRLISLFSSSSFGVFGADMSIVVHNQGPFTLILDSNEQ